MPVVADYTALLSGSAWYVGSPGPRPVVVTYSFSNQPAYSVTNTRPAAAASFQPFTDAAETAARTAIAAWGAVSGVTFIEVNRAEADITFGFYDLAQFGAAGSAGLGTYPQPGAYVDNGGQVQVYSGDNDAGGDIFITTDWVTYSETSGQHTLLHEIGHALGLKHPFNGTATLDPSLDNGNQTVMSYQPPSAAQLGPLDVAAIQSIYGTPSAAIPNLAWSWDATNEIFVAQGQGNNQYLRGPGAVSDVIYTNGGIGDAVVTGAGNDFIYANGQVFSVNAGRGVDTVITGLAYAALAGGVGGSGAFRYASLGGSAFQNYHNVEYLQFTDGVYDTATSSFAPQAAAASFAIAAGNAVQAEGNAGTTAFTFTVLRAGNLTATQSVTWSVAGAGAASVNAADFGGVLPSGTITFAPGQTSQSIAVPILGDPGVEADEDFTVTLSNPTGGATITTATAAGRIINDDTGPLVSLGGVSFPAGRMGPEWRNAGTADVTGDGKADLVWQNPNGEIALWTMDGGRLVGVPFTDGRMGPEWRLVATGDFDGDGRSDFAWQTSDGAVAIWLMDGAHVRAAGLPSGRMGTDWRVAGAGDVDGDGRSDLVWANGQGEAAIWRMGGIDLLGALVAQGRMGSDWGLQIASGDVTGDGVSDLVWTNPVSGGLAVWAMSRGDIASATVGNGAIGSDWHAAGLRDFDRDGIADVLWQNDSGATQLWFMHGADVARAVPLAGRMGPEWSIAGAQDLSGAGIPDIVWTDGSGQAAVWDMRDPVSFIPASGGSRVLPFDRLGAPRMEIADFRAGGGGDVLQLRGLLQQLGYAGSNPLLDGELRLVPDGGSVHVQVDARPGQHAYVTIATLDNVLAGSVQGVNVG
ncbi:MAG: FG-GAP-like repeat-containing protein [Acetobacteraceae bacterium]